MAQYLFNDEDKKLLTKVSTIPAISFFYGMLRDYKNDPDEWMVVYSINEIETLLTIIRSIYTVRELFIKVRKSNLNEGDIELLVMLLDNLRIMLNIVSLELDFVEFPSIVTIVRLINHELRERKHVKNIKIQPMGN